MQWNMEEALAYYKTLGAPADQNVLISLLREIQKESGGSIPVYAIGEAAAFYGVRDSLLLALVRRVPSLRLGDAHVLEMCAGPNCGKATALAACAEELCKRTGGKVQLRFRGCMRLCGKGPNLRFDGNLHHGATEALLRKLLEDYLV